MMKIYRSSGQNGSCGIDLDTFTGRFHVFADPAVGKPIRKSSMFWKKAAKMLGRIKKKYDYMI